MNNEELIEFHKDFTNKMHETFKAKNSDYSGGKGGFANFEIVEKNNLCPTEVGMMVRMSDKMARLTSFITNGNMLVKSESFADACEDLANYSILLAAYVESKKSNPPPIPTTEMIVDGWMKIELAPKYVPKYPIYPYPV